MGSVLACAKSTHALQKLSYSLCGLSLVTNNSSSDSKAFLRFIAFLGSPTAVHRAFLFFDAKAWPQPQTDLFTCTTVLATLWAYFSQTHRPIALHCMHYGITLWAYLSEPLVKDKSQTSKKFDRKTTIPRAPSHGEVYGNIARDENG